MTNCDGSTASALSTLSCLVPVGQLRSAPFNLNWGNTVVVRVSAINAYGNSLNSTSGFGLDSTTGSGGILITNPDPPISLSEVTSLRTNTTLGLSWVNGLSDGGSPVLDYTVFSDQGLSQWKQIASGLTTNRATATGLTIGVTYRFYVMSRNVFGLSSPSDSFSILAAAAPLAPPAPVTTPVLD